MVARLFHVGKAQRQLFVMTFNKLNEVDSIQLPLTITKENRSIGELRTYTKIQLIQTNGMELLC